MEKLDILNREEFIDQLVNVTEHISANRGNVSFAINGVWGCGKSFVLDMYEEKLSQIQSEETASEKYFIIRYNCWKYDYYEEPLIAIVSALIATIEEKTRLFMDAEQKAQILGVLKAVGLSFLSLANDTIKERIGIDIEKVFDTVQKGVSDGQAVFDEEQEYNIYFKLNKAIESLQKLLDSIAEKSTIVLLVDELDRCLPEYAIKVLERLHHLTENVENIVTIISIDKEQLSKNIEHIFGEGSTEQYLKKFIQFETELKIGVVSEKFMDKYSDYINLFDKSIMPFSDSIEEFIQAIFQDIDVRTQEQLVNRAALIHKMLFNEIKDYSFMCIELLMVILHSCYGGIKKFSYWFDTYDDSPEVHPHECPFGEFFRNKFDNAQLAVGYRYAANNNYITRMVEFPEKLYGIIAFTWYKVALTDNGKCSIMLTKKVIPKYYEILLTNITELKKFASLLEFIK